MVDNILSRHRSLALLAATVLAQVMLLAYQIKREHDVRLIRYWTVEAVTPTGRAGTWGFGKIAGVWRNYFALHGARIENQQLRAQLGEVELRNRELESQAAEAQRLTVLLDFREAHPEAQVLAAQVIDASADPASQTIYINRGEQDRVRKNMGVITPDGIVGKVVEVYPSRSEVLMITDRDSGVGVLLADTRTHGVVKGGGDFVARLDYVVNDEKVHKGETVLTSGEDRIFPKDLLVGTVDDFKAGNPFQVIHVQTAARLDRLEDVLVLLTQQQLTPKKAAEGATDSASDEAADGVVQPPPPAAPVYGSNSSQTQARKAASPAATSSAAAAKPGANNEPASTAKPAAQGGAH